MRPLLLHPVALVAIVVLIVNDHVLKRLWPTFITGISDFAGMTFFPLLLLAGWARLRPRRGAKQELRRVAWCCLATGIVFTAIQLCPIAAELYAWGLGALQWPVYERLAPVAHTADPTDLIALPMLGVGPWLLIKQRREP